MIANLQAEKEREQQQNKELRKQILSRDSLIAQQAQDKSVLEAGIRYERELRREADLKQVSNQDFNEVLK